MSVSRSKSLSLQLAAAIERSRLYPLLGTTYRTGDFAPLDLGPGLSDELSQQLLGYEGLEAYVKRVGREQQARVLFGGYGEKRVIYQLSPHFNSDRCIHLGLDLWAPAGSPVYCPLAGWVHSFAYNDQPLDYGATIILYHRLEELTVYTLYGHLDRASLQDLYTGKPFKAGDLLARLGDRTENGGWVPHLHFQLIHDLQGWEGDYPGVATEAEAAGMLQNCPDPALLWIKELSTADQ